MHLSLIKIRLRSPYLNFKKLFKIKTSTPNIFIRFKRSCSYKLLVQSLSPCPSTHAQFVWNHWLLWDDVCISIELVFSPTIPKKYSGVVEINSLFKISFIMNYLARILGMFLMGNFICRHFVKIYTIIMTFRTLGLYTFNPLLWLPLIKWNSLKTLQSSVVIMTWA